jgi:transposase
MNLAAELAQFDPHATPPETLAALMATWVEQAKKDAEQIERDAEQIAQQRAEILNKDTKIAALTFELAWHKRMKFAAKSEAFNAQQRDLFNESLAEDVQAIEAELEQLTPPPARTRKKPTGRQPLPSELPRVVHRHEPESCACGACGADLIKIGEDITEQLDVEPARFTVQRHIRPQYACRHCDTVTAAAIPAAVIDGGLATPGLLAWVTIQK